MNRDERGPEERRGEVPAVPTELTTDSEAIDEGLNDSDLGDPSGAGQTSPQFHDGEELWEEAVEKARE